MFCKWCGADIPNSASKCQRCGKEIPPLSNCGGFYDLVPGAKRSVASVEECQDTTLTDEYKENTDSRKTPAAPVKSRKNVGKILNNILLAIMLVGLVAVLLYVIRMNGKVKDCMAAVEKNADKIESMQVILSDIQISVPKDSVTEPTTPTDSDSKNEALLTEQDIEIKVDVTYSEADVSANTTVNLKDCADTATDKISFNNADGTLSHIQIDLSEAEKCFEVKIENTIDSVSSSNRTLSFNCDVDAKVFGEEVGTVEYQWQFRDLEDEAWKDLDEDIFTVSPDGKTITYPISDIDKLLTDGSDRIELRLSFVRNNDNGGSLSVEINGIAIAKENRSDN